MAGDFNQSLNQSARDFQNLILPIFKDLWRGCDFLHVETNSDDLAQALDNYSGIDVIKVKRGSKAISGIASRIQRSEKCWATFTVRCERDTKTPTEYFKRIAALKNGDLAPKLTYQAYVNPQGDKLLGMAIARTADLMRFIESEKPPVKHTNSHQFGQAAFFVISWRDFSQKYELIQITPKKNGYLAQWSTDERFIDGGMTP